MHILYWYWVIVIKQQEIWKQSCKVMFTLTELLYEIFLKSVSIYYKPAEKCSTVWFKINLLFIVFDYLSKKGLSFPYLNINYYKPAEKCSTVWFKINLLSIVFDYLSKKGLSFPYLNINFDWFWSILMLLSPHSPQTL